MNAPSRGSAELTLRWRGTFANAEVNELHAQTFDHRHFEDDWGAQLEHYSLGWVTARDQDVLVGFVNVAWDGGVHAFVLDTMTAVAHQRRGIATAMLELAVAEGKKSGCEWLHVDFDDHLEGFYTKAGFVPTKAGLIALTP